MKIRDSLTITISWTLLCVLFKFEKLKAMHVFFSFNWAGTFFWFRNEICSRFLTLYVSLQMKYLDKVFK